MVFMGTNRSQRGLVPAVALTVAIAGAGLGGTSASARGPDDPPDRYSGPEQVETGVTPPPAKSGFAGPRRTGPSIVESPSFGRSASAAGIGLRTYRYSRKHGNATTLDVYTPRAFTGRHGRTVRTVILVHGGAWQTGDRIDLESKAVQLARLGLVVVSVNYRLAAKARWPAQRNDVDDAVRYLRRHAKRLNIDNQRTVLLGSSAGGQIAAAVATLGSGQERFRGLVTLSGLVNPRLMAETDPTYSNAVIPELLLRCLPVQCPERYDSASGAAGLDSTDMPSLLFHSRHEKPWDAAQAKDFVRASLAVGVPSRLVLLSGDRHGISTWSTIFPTLRTWLLERLGKKDRR